MAVIQNTQTVEEYLPIASIDFVNQFGGQIESLMEMLNLQRKISMNIGDTIQTYTSEVTLTDGNVAPGDIIPLSKVKTKPGEKYTLAFEKYAKLVPMEVIQQVGHEQAITDSDNKMLREIQKGVRDKFFAQLKKGTGKVEAKNIKDAFAQAWGHVETAFAGEGVGTIVFINPLDVAKYLGQDSLIVTQNAFGLQYLENFMGTNRTIITTQVEQGKIYATAPENLNLAYANMTGGEIGKGGFGMTSDETGIIGVTREVVKDRLSVTTYAALATLLFAERLDGIFEITIGEEAPSEVAGA